MQVGRQVLEAFSARLLALDRLSADASPARLMRAGLDELRALVPFEAAWWGETSGGMDGIAPRNWLSGRINLSPDFAREWNRIGHRDSFALESLQRLDTVVRSATFDDPEPAVEAFARRHDLFNVLAVTRALPGSGLLQFISLYRGQAGTPFSPVESLLFDQFSAHLMQRWSARVSLSIEGAGAARAGDGHGLLDAAGEFVYLGARLALLLHEHYPHWDGAQPPSDLVAALRGARDGLKLGTRRVAVEPSGELLLLSLAPRRQAPPLPPRELGVALLYADGRTHKQIARDTGLSAATVRTYLRDAYQRLGVTDKVALGRALAGRRARARAG